MDSGKDTNRYKKSEETQTKGFGEDDGGNDMVILFLFFFNLPNLSHKIRANWMENGRPTYNTFKTR